MGYSIEPKYQIFVKQYGTLRDLMLVGHHGT